MTQNVRLETLAVDTNPDDEGAVSRLAIRMVFSGVTAPKADILTMMGRIQSVVRTWCDEHDAIAALERLKSEKAEAAEIVPAGPLVRFDWDALTAEGRAAQTVTFQSGRELAAKRFASQAEPITPKELSDKIEAQMIEPTMVGGVRLHQLLDDSLIWTAGDLTSRMARFSILPTAKAKTVSGWVKDMIESGHLMHDFFNHVGLIQINEALEGLAKTNESALRASSQRCDDPARLTVWVNLPNARERRISVTPFDLHWVLVTCGIDFKFREDARAMLSQRRGRAALLAHLIVRRTHGY